MGLIGKMHDPRQIIVMHPIPILTHLVNLGGSLAQQAAFWDILIALDLVQPKRRIGRRLQGGMKKQRRQILKIRQIESHPYILDMPRCMNQLPSWILNFPHRPVIVLRMVRIYLLEQAATLMMADSAINFLLVSWQKILTGKSLMMGYRMKLRIFY